MATNNRTLGRFDLAEIPPAPRGVPQVEVAFDIDANGIVHVSAKDLGTGKEQKIRIETSSGMSKDDIDKLVKEGEAHAEEDKKKHELVQSRNNLDNMIYQTEKSLKENGDKISDDEKKKIEEASKEAKDALKSEKAEELNKAFEKLTQASHVLAQKMYEEAAKKAEAEKGAGAAAAGGSEKKEKGKEDVVDADFEVVDEDEKKKGKK